ncbi:uncharacterized protein LOC143274284 [Peromyscus maniculatus bairdii]|uniref:uncharacterized protein LOC143274284 n=1 Tax=Peromyscus maniculatus bairdii TaxID=230844 RepID=UPI003FD625B8
MVSCAFIVMRASGLQHRCGRAEAARGARSPVFTSAAAGDCGLSSSHEFPAQSLAPLGVLQGKRELESVEECLETGESLSSGGLRWISSGRLVVESVHTGN